MLPATESSWGNRASSSSRLAVGRARANRDALPFVPAALGKILFQGKLENELIQSHRLTQPLTGCGDSGFKLLL